ncbi:MAG: GNAT family N-acetyltransferase [Thermomicrobiales bacterium]
MPPEPTDTASTSTSAASAFALPPETVTSLALAPWLHDPGPGAPLLRPFLPTDRDALAAAAQSEDIGHYTSIEWPFTSDAASRLIARATADWRAGTAARFAIADPAAPGVILGTASLLHIFPDSSDAEIGYWLGAAGRGRGLARAATEALTAWAFISLGLARVHLLVDLDNEASHAVARRAGFTLAGEERWRHPSDPTKDGPVARYLRERP